MMVLVCGGRDYSDKLHVWAVLHGIHGDEPISHIIEGGADGADRFARLWAHSTNNVQNVQCPANWDRYGKAAGPRRNKAMLALRPELVVAFPGGRGTANMIALAEANGIQVIRATQANTQVEQSK